MFLSKSSVVNTIILIFLDRRFPFCETRLSVKIRKDRGKFSHHRRLCVKIGKITNRLIFDLED